VEFYWVNLGSSFDEVKEHRFLWAPSYTLNKNGTKTVNAGWKHVPDVKKGDVFFCYKDKKIIYLARAKSNAHEADRPENRVFRNWKIEGYRIDVELTVLDVPLNVAEFRYDIIGRFNEQCSPKLFGTKGEVSQSYLISIPKSMAALVLDNLGSEFIEFFETSSQAEKKINNSQEREREARIQARIGQGQFRKDVLSRWNNTCPVTGVDSPNLLIASHIHSWFLSDSDEKVDCFNGLPLSPNADKLFDKGLISFSNDGTLLVSPDLSTNTLIALGISEKTKIKGLTAKHHFYLEKHRNTFGYE